MDKFLDVDVIATLGRISDQYDFRAAGLSRDEVDAIRQMAGTPSGRRADMLWWLEYGSSDVFDERDAYIQGSGLARMLESCLDPNLSWRIRLYGIEATGMRGGSIRGNIYQYDPPEYARFAARNAQPCARLALAFAGGGMLRIQKDGLTDRKREQLESAHGGITLVLREAADEAALQSALRHGREPCAALPAGRLGPHLRKLREQQIQIMAERIASRLRRIREPNHPLRTAYVADVPREIWGADGRALDRLASRLRELLGDPSLYIGRLGGNISGLFAITGKCPYKED